MKAYGKNIRISPKKLRVVAEVVRGMDAVEASKFLKFAPKKGADLLYKILSSAIANAVNNDSQKEENLKIGALIITKGIVYKRGNPVSRGRMHPILKRTSNVKLELQVK
ncbi:50S ribosomal protein L22 [Candidatus Gracilibacteria bacterium]|nr:50S ribosomal protein L22 [Candidatus Gracilibacteria bacterium]NVP17736.1 50S ribosomal protein L22 [Candidatus Gracilibacteria bacterium]